MSLVPGRECPGASQRLDFQSNTEPSAPATRPLAGRRFDLVLDTQRRLLTTLAVRRIRHGRFVSGAARYLLSDARPSRPLAAPATPASSRAKRPRTQEGGGAPSP